MDTFLSYLATAALFALVLLPALAGLARERRIDRELRDARRRGGETPREAAVAARPATAARRPYVGSWARI